MKGAQYGSTDCQNLFGISFLDVDAFAISTGKNSSTTPSVVTGF